MAKSAKHPRARAGHAKKSAPPSAPVRETPLQAPVISGVGKSVPRSDVERVFIERVDRATDALRHIAHSADAEVLLEAISAPTDIGMLARIAHATASSQAAIGELDPLADLLAKGADAKIELLRRCGGVLSVSQVAERLGITRQGVDKRRREGKLLAIPRGDDFGYPAFQFAQGQVVPGVPQITTLLADAPWTALQFLATPLEELRERSPLEVLKSKDEAAKDLVMRFARIAASDGFG